VQIANPHVANVKKRIADDNVRLTDLESNQIKAANDSLARAQNALFALDQQRDADRDELASGILQKSSELAQA
jgi:hypothetical protein